MALEVRDRIEAGRRGTRRREQTDLFATILEVIKRYHGEARITRVSYGCGMPVDRLRASLETLVALGLVSIAKANGYSTYDITPRGQEFLDTYWRMRGFTDLLEGGAARFV
jgi:predicted transcriptional regulator